MISVLKLDVLIIAMYIIFENNEISTRYSRVMTTNLAIIPSRQILSMLNESTHKKGSTFLPANGFRIYM